jgi:hypothetical protein
MTTHRATSTPASGLDKGGRLSRLWRAIAAWLSPPEPIAPDPAPSPGRLTQRQDVIEPFPLPALGHVFDFSVFASLRWTSDGLTCDEFYDQKQKLVSAARRELRHVADALAGKYEPYRARELEDELNRQLDEIKPWRFPLDTGELSCRAAVRVSLDDRVRQYMQPYWERRIKMECEHEVELRRAQLADQLTQRWLAVLERLRDNPLADGAARLAERELADVMTKVRANLREDANKLQEFLDNTLRNSVDAYERAEAFDLAIDELRRRTSAQAGTGADGRAPAEPFAADAA